MDEGLKTKGDNTLVACLCLSRSKRVCAMPSVPLNDTFTDSAEALGLSLSPRMLPHLSFSYLLIEVSSLNPSSTLLSCFRLNSL